MKPTVRYPSDFMTEAELVAKYADPWDNHSRDALWMGLILVAVLFIGWGKRWRRANYELSPPAELSASLH